MTRTTSTDPLARLRSLVDLGDLHDLVGRPAPFATLVLSAPSGHADAAHRLDTRWKRARAELERNGWPTPALERLDATMATVAHDDAEAIVALQAHDGHVLLEPILLGVRRDLTEIAPLPRLSAVIEHRQRALPHIVVVTDRAGADVIGFERGTPTVDETVDGSTLHIHKGRFGGWSHRRYQQRAENTWERNAGDVADAVRSMAADIDPVLLAIAGDVRARTLLAEAMGDAVADRVVILDSGDADGITDELLRLVADVHARYQVAAIERVRAARGQGSAVEGPATLDALVEGRVDTLLVHDDGGDAPVDDDGARLVDRAIALALKSGAGIVTVPDVADLDTPIVGLLRW